MLLPQKPRHIEQSLLMSMDDEPGEPDEWLLDKALSLIDTARVIDMQLVSGRIENGPKYPDIWPGEHYKLLAAAASWWEDCQVIVEIGTATGVSALAMKWATHAKIHTFDVVPWQQYPDTVFVETDFDENLVQHVDDLSTDAGFVKHKELLESADMIFVDAAKDGILEWQLLERFGQCNFQGEPLIIFDDTRVMNMLAVWRSITKPKLDLTSFGHWSGTGLVHWTKE